MMDDSPMDGSSPLVRRVAAAAIVVVVGVAGLSYAVHEHHAAQSLAAQNQQANAELDSTRGQLKDLTAQVSALEQRSQQEAAAQQAELAKAQQPIVRHVGKPHAGHPQSQRLNRMQAQLDRQEQEIAATRSDLTSSTTELNGSIARTHGELVVLEKKGQRNYFEFDLEKEKQFRREGPLGISLRKANVKHQYADLQLLVDDRSLTQKHVNLDQPVLFYGGDSDQPIEVVINDITKNHIHGYVSAPTYGKSELAAMAQASEDNGTNPGTQPAARKVLTVSQQDASTPDGPQN
ncbi:MAG TPA: hypothetical protein VMD25_11580 [Acidobacteriaceae bacterium]|nr:hypothetical protein [Acidobacteriaceae bacterium]